VLHLLYARFVYKVFTDLGYIESSHGGEPFPKFFAHGLIIKEGAKMSKSKGNVVVPDIYIKKYGADTLRTYLMFLGPFSEGGDFQDAGIDGINRFLKRVWKLFTTKEIASTEIDPAANMAMNKAIKGVTSDLSIMHYNTAIAKMMTWYNALSQRESLSKEEVEVFLKLLAPFAPHMTEELYQRYSKGQRAEGKEQFESIHTSKWPEFDEAALVDQSVTIAVQVNGKLRDTIVLESANSNQQTVEQMAKESANVKRFLEGKEIKKVIYVPGKILNIVTS
jgi:leucyl-tRNA synthetase